MNAELVCFTPGCRKRYRLDEVVYQCSCGGLLEVRYDFGQIDPSGLVGGVAGAAAEP